MKKLRFLFLAVIILATIVTFSVCADAAVIASGNCGGSIKWTLDSDGTFVLEGKGSWGSPSSPSNLYDWDEYKSQIKKVIIGEGITDIGDNAFWGCSSLKTVTIPNSVKSLGKYCFYACSSLRTVTIPNSVKSLGKKLLFCMLFA